MSIKEVGKKSNPPKTLPNEEEFDIVTTDSTAQNKPKISNSFAYFGILILVGAISFGVGKLVNTSTRSSDITVSHEELSQMEVASPKEAHVSIVRNSVPKEEVAQPLSKPTKQAPKETSTQSSGPIVASKNGTKYYLATCSGAKRISEANKIYFATEQDAKNSGRTPSSTCKGLYK